MCGELLSTWSLPTRLPVGGRQMEIRADFRQVLQVIDCLEDEQLPLFARWRKALRLFYVEPVAADDRSEAMEQLCGFISAYRDSSPGPRLMCWRQEAPLIAAQVNQVAGREVRAEEFLHWWTFLGYFHAIGPGPFAQVVAIREKLRTGKKLDENEQQFYNKNTALVRLQDSRAVRQEKAQLEQLLKGGCHGTEH